ncbi:MAG: 3-deoxy-7-phosphoheptulonate synthase class II, partial [Acidimicrobiia bacterium]|nr:3-deoxy-7-phosphoheptulonate synthase class II [Acidimicrobiia bacterium]
MSEWTPESWRAFNARQQPAWPDPGEMERVLKELSQRPPLIFAGEARHLQKQLAAVSRG